jgi:hypothetical protein
MAAFQAGDARSGEGFEMGMYFAERSQHAFLEGKDYNAD